MSVNKVLKERIVPHYLMNIFRPQNQCAGTRTGAASLKARRAFGQAWSPEGPKGPRESPMGSILMLGLNPEVLRFHQKRNLERCLPAYTMFSSFLVFCKNPDFQTDFGNFQKVFFVEIR